MNYRNLRSPKKVDIVDDDVTVDRIIKDVVKITIIIIFQAITLQ